MNAVEDLAVWLTAVWDEEEHHELAKRTWRSDAPPMDVTTDLDGEGVYVSNHGSSVQHWLSAEDYDRNWLIPAPDKQVLARIAADRKILAECMKILAVDCWEYSDAPDLAEFVIRQKAGEYADRPDYPLAVERQGVEG